MNDFIPESFKSSKNLQRTGKSGIFAGSLELAKEGNISIKQNNIFDDILIGNFMKTKLINVPSLYPDFTPYVSKYGDNGKARTDQELKKYFEYYKLNSANYWLDYLKLKSESIIRPKIEKYKNIYFAARYIKRKIF